MEILAQALTDVKLQNCLPLLLLSSEHTDKMTPSSPAPLWFGSQRSCVLAMTAANHANMFHLQPQFTHLHSVWRWVRWTQGSCQHQRSPNSLSAALGYDEFILSMTRYPKQTSSKLWECDQMLSTTNTAYLNWEPFCPLGLKQALHGTAGQVAFSLSALRGEPFSWAARKIPHLVTSNQSLVTSTFLLST